MFDRALAGWLGMAGTVCILGPTCGEGMALEHNGDLYSCDHFVEPDHYLGNILKTPLIDLVASEEQRRFGQDKKDSLPRTCRQCESYNTYLQRRVPQKSLHNDLGWRARTQLSLRRLSNVLQPC
jgi:radical SAM protein with 4Fe4S-binding SPASM domain